MKWKNLLTTGVQTAATAVFGSLATASGVNSAWYAKLRKPSFQPPPSVFPVAWTVLYTDIALTSAAVLGRLQDESATEDARREERGYRRALALNLVLNAGWSWSFFARKDTRLATVTAAALAVSSTDLARRAGRARGSYGLALLPYAGWCTFATALSGRIHQLNS